MKVREIISQLREYLNNVNPDTRFSNQYLHACIINATQLILKREAESRKLYKSLEAFQSLDCIELEPVDVAKCIPIKVVCATVQRSVKKIPKTFLSGTGAILNVFSFDRSVQFLQSTPSAYSSAAKREFKSPIKYYWIIDEYLYIPDSSISNATALGMFVSGYEVNKFNDPNTCIKFMDADCGIPDWLREDILKTCLQTIAGVTKRIPEDTNPNLNSNN